MFGAVSGAHDKGVAQAVGVVKRVNCLIAVVEAVGPYAVSGNSEGAVAIYRRGWRADGLENIIAVVDIGCGQGAADGVDKAVFYHHSCRGASNHSGVVAAGDGDGYWLVDRVTNCSAAICRSDGVMQN